uniref:GH3 C-terminal domain-containing protein n=1 Tax=Ananas comosus var. bracteatus TaxID=296719 RepID=A0A6V7NLW6_ANACO|nr:unnamed protein product [Ananas comosus var. bracteatus]
MTMRWTRGSGSARGSGGWGRRGGRRLPHPIVVDDDDDNGMDGDIVEWFEGWPRTRARSSPGPCAASSSSTAGPSTCASGSATTCVCRTWTPPSSRPCTRRQSPSPPMQTWSLTSRGSPTATPPLSSQKTPSPCSPSVPVPRTGGPSMCLSHVLVRSPPFRSSAWQLPTDRGCIRSGRGKGAGVPVQQQAVQDQGRADGGHGDDPLLRERGVHGEAADDRVVHVQPLRGDRRRRLQAVDLLPPPPRPGLLPAGGVRGIHLRLQPRPGLRGAGGTVGGSLRRPRAGDTELRDKLAGDEKGRAGLLLLLGEPGAGAGIEHRCRELKRSGWRGLIPALWPNAKYVYSIMTGSMQPYLSKLRHYAGGVALVGADYGSTESWIGRAGFIDPSQGWAAVRAGPHHLHRAVQVQAGDVVEVAGFYRGCPQLTFVCRRKLILSVNVDKNTERDLQLAVEKGAALLARAGAELVDFTSHAEVGAHHPGHYVVYWELKDQRQEAEEAGDDDAVLQECCGAMDAAFADHGYVVSRRARTIGPLELRVVECGTFRHILEHYIRNGAAMSQYKTPRCTTDRALLTILDRSTVKRFWSTAYG